MLEILRMVIIDIVINTLLDRLTLDPAGMHRPAWTMLLFLVIIIIY